MLDLSTGSCLQWTKHADITGLQLVRCVRRETAKDDVVLEAKRHYLERFVRTEPVVYQYSRLTVGACPGVRIEHMLDPLKVDARVHITAWTAGEMPAWHSVRSPTTKLSGARPDDQR